MLFRERPNPDDLQRVQAPTGAGGGNLPDLTQQAENFSAAGDDAIARALSGDSTAFLSAVRQSGGE